MTSTTNKPAQSEQKSKQNDTYLAFDFGIKKIGVAVGQRELGIANALTTIPSIPKQVRWEHIQRLTAEWQPAGFVVGLSKNMDGSEHEVTLAILKFCRQLEGRLMRPVATVDETLSSREAWQLLYDDCNTGHRKALQQQDQMAAQLILKSWFETAGKSTQ